VDDAARRALVDDLSARLSPAEKAGQLTQYFYFGGLAEDDAVVWSPAQQAALVEAALARGGAGSLLFVFDPEQINRLQRLVVEGNRHGIPALFGFDVIHGLRTIFPVPLGLAASWDPDVVERAQAVAAREARAIGGAQALRRLRRRPRGAGLRRGEPVRPRPAERVPAAVPGRRRPHRRGRQHRPLHHRGDRDRLSPPRPQRSFRHIARQWP
jgi:hypothetical protein